MKIKKYSYTERVVAFIDILGFKNHINKSINNNNSTNSDKFGKIQSALDIISETADKDSPINQGKEVTLFSDSIIISFEIFEKSEVFSTLIALLHMNMELLRFGFLIRGGITVGRCFHTQSRVFGPAVNKAYDLEQKANYPRIVIDKDVIITGIENHANHHTPKDESEHLKQLLRKDSDGQWYLDYFSTALHEVNDEYSQFLYIQNLENNIRINLNKYKNDERVIPKYNWMKSKYNEMIVPMISQENIERFRLSQPEIVEGLESLSLIN